MKDKKSNRVKKKPAKPKTGNKHNRMKKNHRPHVYMQDIPGTFKEFEKKHDQLKKKGVTKKQMKKEENQLAYGLHHKYLSLKRKPFYTKEYDSPKTNVFKVIVKESIKLLILVSLLNSIGGMFLESIKATFITILPLIIILPALNGMIGNYGTTVSARVSTMLHKGSLMLRWWSDPKIKKLLVQIFILSLITAVFVSLASLLASAALGFAINMTIAAKIFAICIIDTAILVLVISIISIIAGRYFHNKKEDPDNFLVPITTTVADFGNILILFVLILLLF